MFDEISGQCLKEFPRSKKELYLIKQVEIKIMKNETYPGADIVCGRGKHYGDSDHDSNISKP
jgi:hypothetical protein